MRLRLAFSLAFIILPAAATLAATLTPGQSPGEVVTYGVPVALAGAMGLLGMIIKASLKRQLDSLDRLSRAALIMAQELVKRPCLADSKSVRHVADALLDDEPKKEL